MAVSKLASSSSKHKRASTDAILNMSRLKHQEVNLVAEMAKESDSDTQDYSDSDLDLPSVNEKLTTNGVVDNGKVRASRDSRGCGKKSPGPVASTSLDSPQGEEDWDHDRFERLENAFQNRDEKYMDMFAAISAHLDTLSPRSTRGKRDRPRANPDDREQEAWN